MARKPRKIRGARGAVRKAYIYARVSTETQVERGQGIDVQLKLCRDHCRRDGIRVEGEFVDRGVSGASVEREGLGSMLANLNGVDCIVVVDTSRLWRDIYPQAMVVKALRDSGKDIRSVDEPTFTVYNEDDPNQYLVNGIMGLLDSWERLVIAQRLRRGRRQKASQGMKAAGRAPYGYRWAERAKEGRREKVIVAEPEEAQIVAKMYRAYLRLGSVAKVQRLLSSQGHANQKDKPFSRSQVHAVLTNTFYIATVRHGGIEVQGTHEPLISRVVFGKVQKALERNRKR